ncbi:hypothetical protein HMPREF9372_3665 [Sporosarcina newyorkensis 2681]|uniref:Uncharacterized protein n=1 Tax=Sporosarcina newyorkensis 2681 TaxID=1027292 RepID=F9DXY4_9BACL|nr:hypothetical protein HMPREF9372_3665 [Sporosarcina newyorkensis 2681]
MIDVRNAANNFRVNILNPSLYLDNFHLVEQQTVYCFFSNR